MMHPHRTALQMGVQVAEFVVPGSDPRCVAPGAIKDIEVLATDVGGRCALAAPERGTPFHPFLP